MQRICYKAGEKHKKCEGEVICIKVYGFTENEQGIMEIANDLKAEQEFVGGSIEVYPVIYDFLLVCNAAGVNDGLKERVVVLGMGEGEAVDLRGIQQIIHGDCFVCRFDGCDAFESIADTDVEVIKHYVKSVVSITNGVIEIER